MVMHTEITEDGDWHSMTVYFHPASTGCGACGSGGGERATP